jgi:PAS domain-containing protein
LPFFKDAEQDRLAQLRRLEVLDTPTEPLFDRFVSVAAESFRVPMAAISLVDSDRQWFKASVGLGVRETPRDIAFCDHVIRSDRVMIVADAKLDDRFRANPLVLQAPHVRFYAGAPLTAEGYRLGTLCILDVKARPAFSGSRQLGCLAESVAQALVLRSAAQETQRVARLAEDRRRLLELAEEAGHVATWCWDVSERTMSWSDEAFRIHGLSPSDPAPDLEGLLQRYRPTDARALAEMVRQSLGGDANHHHRAKLQRPDGTVRDVVVTVAGGCSSGAPNVRVLGTFQDVTRP